MESGSAPKVHRGLPAVILFLTTTAVAQTVQFDSICPGFEPELIAAFEARARAELAVRQLSGSVELHCAEAITIEWVPADAAARRVTVEREAVTSDSLFERFNTLLWVLASPESPPPEEPETTPPPPAESSPPVPSPPVPSPSASAERPKAPPPSVEAPVARDPAAPRPARSAALDELQPSSWSNPQAPPARVAVGAAATLWDSAPAWGVQVAGALPLAGSWSAVADIQLTQALPAPEAFSARQLQAHLGVGYTLGEGLMVQTSLLVGAVAIQAPAGFTLVSGADESFCDLDAGDDGGLCGTLGARAALYAELASGSFRPELGLALEWSPRSIRAVAREPDGEPRELQIPSLRPTVVLRVAWLDDD